MEITLTAFDEYLEFDSDAEYLVVEGSADYSTIEAPDGETVPLANVAAVGFIGTSDEYVDVSADAEAVATASGPVQVVEPDADPHEVVTIGELTQITKLFSGNGINFQHEAAAFTAAEGIVYLCDTSGGAFSVTPFEPQSDGEWFGVWDVGGEFAANNLTVLQDGRTFQGFATDLIMNCSNTGVMLISEGTNWNVFSLSQFGAEEFVGSLSQQTLYIQADQPTADPPWVWYELDGGGNLANIKVGL